ncbi:late competence protein ComER [Bacillus infantis]|uniref:late competence protein ComER n=1 Tax=Bacillus infantis TaxID=324767 RepID=UPI003CFA83A8
MNIGFIGTGNMGKILIQAMLDAKAVPPSSVTITNRTLEKAAEIQKEYSGLNLAEGAAETAANSDLIFICVKPYDFADVIQEIRPYLSDEDCVISITSPISAEQLESFVPCSAARVIPSITNRAHAGVALVTYGEHFRDEWKQKLMPLIEAIAKPVEIEEEITRVSSDIVSCGPAFFSYLTQQFINAAVAETKINRETATVLASEMLIGMGELLKKGHYTLPALQRKVCVKGGITGEGIKVLEKELGDVFRHVFQATHSKFEEDLTQVKKQFTVH